MNTELITKDINAAAKIIKTGGLVAVPTETVYGLAGNGLDEAAVNNIYEVKGRPTVKPLSLMVSGADAMDSYCLDVPQQARILADKFWPGPLTIILKAKSDIPSIVLAGGDTVGLRCPDHPLTLELLKTCKLPLAAPSANPSSEPSPKNAQKVMEYFNGKIAAVIDGGECGIGLESTIIDMSAEPYKILRHGALAEDDIAAALAEELKIIGITGGTGCGKTTALNVLDDMGALILDCDRVYHELLASSEALISDLDEAFPGSVENGKVDTKALGKIVFSDDKKLLKLNEITHKHILVETKRRLYEHAMSGGTVAALDAIELISSGMADICCTTLAVLAEKELRAQRIMARDGVSREYALLRIDAQRPDSYFIENCEHVLYNNADPEKFRTECDQLFKEVLKNG